MEFGRKYKSIITGFTGIATGRISYITGCDRVCLTDENGEEKWFDYNLLVFVDKGVEEKLCNTNKYSDLDKAIYDFGILATDSITSFTGRIVAKAIYISGDISYGLSPKYSAQNRDNDASWFDEGRMKVVDEDKTDVNKNKDRVGGVANPTGLKIR